jgi:hypothetical protein
VRSGSESISVPSRSKMSNFIGSMIPRDLRVFSVSHH